MLNIFCGFDQREAPGYHVFCESVIHRSSVAVAFTPMPAGELATGTNEFTMSRFLVPFLMGYKGRAVFFDAADMICLADVREMREILDDMRPSESVRVVHHNYRTKNKIKYIGTPMESPNIDYVRKNWASAMAINCEHPDWLNAKPGTLTRDNMGHFLQLSHLSTESIGELPPRWNVLVDEGQLDTAEDLNPAILHWTAGIPAFEHYKHAPCADLWRLEWERTYRLFHTG